MHNPRHPSTCICGRYIYVRAKLLILDLDEGDTGDTGASSGDTASSVTHDGHEAILEEVVGPGLIAAVRGGEAF